MNHEVSTGLRRLPPEVVRSVRVAGSSLFTSLPPDTAAHLASAAVAWAAEPGAVVVRAGDASESVYVVIDGVVRVEQRGVVVARLGRGELFGEMALLAKRPRTADVLADVPSELLEIPRAALERMQRDDARVAAALERICRTRLIDNLARSSPLFTGVDPDTARRALQSFAARKVAAGAVVVEEGKPGPGLFVVLDGALAVSALGNEGPLLLKNLGAGDVFGEMSLVDDDDAASATVKATTECTLLVLPRPAFRDVAAGNSTLKARLTALAAERRMHNERVAGYLPDETMSAILV
jgi:CRP-like cAMP-binding protein